jgi:predicted peptidase
MKAACLLCPVFAALFFAGCGQMEKEEMTFELIERGGQHSQTFEKTVTKTLSCNYLLFLPEDYGKQEKDWPMMLFLHGAGERGSDLQKVKIHGPPKIVEAQGDFPFVVVSPQCPEDRWWNDDLDVLIKLLDEIVATYDIDQDRVYLTGLSMGGYGTWALASKYPDRFAAIAPICGGGTMLMALGLKDVPVWAFHGAKDQVVPVGESERMVETINARGGNAKLTAYPEAGHDSWTKSYENQELYDWLLSHHRGKRPKYGVPD